MLAPDRCIFEDSETFCFVNCGKDASECPCIRRMQKRVYRTQLLEDMLSVDVEDEKDEEEK
jgi:hypothetical protein